ncbi:AprI/Inh family metalloprotease inhibitor [Methylobacterium sp. JK268]
MRRLLPVAAALLAAAPALFPGAPALADPARPRSEAEARGTWALSLNGSHRRCVVTLTDEEAPGGHALRFPAGCRRALPVLGALTAWRLEDGALRLVGPGAKGLDFALTETPGDLKADLGPAEVYALAPEGPRAAPPEAPAATVQPAAVAPAAEPARPAADPGPAEALAGTYALDRATQKDTCRLALEGTAVRVLEGCRDLGLTVFDPVSWRAEPGRITLVARRGHTVTLVPAGEGLWRREPEVGMAFTLRRVTP